MRVLSSTMRPMTTIVFGLLCLCAGQVALGADDVAQGPWPAPVKGWVPPQAGEHPRLFFRKADLPKLKQRAQTPEGKAIIERLKYLMGGGEAMPTVYGASQAAYDGKNKDLPLGAYSLWHAAGYGFLYQLTGDKKYADFGKQCVQKAFDGQRDGDDRYAWVNPGGFLRAGPSISAIAEAYDLCYDGWDAEFRKTVVEKFMSYKYQTNRDGGGTITFEKLCMDPHMPPGSNHFGLQAGGAAISVCALMGDPGTDPKVMARYMEGVEKNMIRALSEGFGDGGYFFEHEGPGVIGSSQTLVPALQALKVAAGKDFISPRPNAQWLTMKWVMELISWKGKPYYPNHFPSGPLSYGDEFFERYGGHFEGHFAQGFGAVLPEQVPALLWTYKTFIEPTEQNIPAWPFKTNKLKPGEKSYDATLQPYRAILSFVNWPIGVEPKNPETILPKILVDHTFGHYVFRNRWKDEDDCIVAVLFGARTRFDKVDPGKNKCRTKAWGLQEHINFGTLQGDGKVGFFKGAVDGSGVVTAGANSIAVDFSKASGADALVVMVGPAATGGKDGGKAKISSIKAGNTTFSILSLASGTQVEPKADGDKVIVGGQTISFDGQNIVLGKMAAEWKDPAR